MGERERDKEEEELDLNVDPLIVKYYCSCFGLLSR
jgi:hypothetical protein